MSEFNTKATILRPSAVKLQSPPYPISSDDTFIGAWRNGVVNLDKVIQRLPELEVISANSEMSSSVQIESIVVTYNDNGIETLSTNSEMTSSTTIEQVVVKYTDNGIETLSTNSEMTSSTTIEQVVVKYTNDTEVLSTNSEMTSSTTIQVA